MGRPGATVPPAPVRKAAAPTPGVPGPVTVGTAPKPAPARATLPGAAPTGRSQSGLSNGAQGTTRTAVPNTGRRTNPPAPAAVAAPYRPDPAAVRAAEAQAAAARERENERPDIEFYIGAKADSVVGQGDAFGRFSNTFGGGAEAGFEIYGIELYGDALILGSEQYYFTLQVGFDMDFAPVDNVRLSVGAFTGPMFFLFPRQEVESASLTPQQREALLASGFSEDTLNSLLKAYDDAADEEADLNRLAVGYNLLRLRLALEYLAAPFAILGVHATGSYHYLISGDDVGADLKYRAIQDVERGRELTPEQSDLLREATGARPLNVDNVGGLNLQAGVYFRLVL